MRKVTARTLIAAAASSLLLLSSTTAGATGVNLRAAGASSVQTFFDKCKEDYSKVTGDTMPYNGQGSGSGKTAIGNGTADIAFSDSRNTNQDRPANMIHIPFVAWPVAVMYNLNSSKTVNLSTETIAKIFAGKITNWSDPQIAADNNKSYQVPVYKTSGGKTVLDKDGAPVVLRYKTVKNYFTFPNQRIIVLYRSSTSGTSNNFTTAMNKLHPDIWNKPGNDSFSTAFPGSISSDPVGFRSATTATALAQLSKDTKYSISYNEVSYAPAYGLGVANVINAAGNAISPNTDGVLGAFSVADISSTGEVTFNYSNKLPSQYPLTATTYALVLTKYSSAALAASVKDAVSYYAFNCPSVADGLGFAKTTKTSDLGKVILSQLAKIGN